MTEQTILLSGHITPEQEKSYLHLPFSVPAGAARVEVAFAYNQRIDSDPTLTGGNTVDLGLFDERGTAFLAAGFRGWSGSERDRVWVAEQDASPGYQSGPIHPGTWYVLLGLYKIAPAGCDYQVNVTITLQSDPAAGALGAAADLSADNDARGLPRSAPPALAAPWLRGELHCHTFHSDGELSPEELVAHASARGMDFLAVTDHNNISARKVLRRITDPGLVLILGMEVTTFKGHFNIWGIPDWVDFRVQGLADMQAVIQYARDRGALTSCNHPKPFGPDWDYPEVTNYHAVEVWNGPWNGLNEVSLEYWTGLIGAGRRIPAVGGADYHRPGEEAGGRPRDVGTPTNWVYLPAQPGREITAEDILAALRQGHVSLSAEPDGPFIDLRGGENGQYLGGDALPEPVPTELPIQARVLRGEGCELRLIDQTGVIFTQPVTSTDARIDWRMATAASRFVRAELRDPEERLWAMSNPVYL